MIKKSIIFIISGVFILGVGVLLGIFIPRLSPPPSSPAFEFINPTVTSKLNKHFIINFLPLKKQLEAIQSEYSHKTYIYFNYLNNGSWLGINERENFAAASLVKVPLAMSVYKMVEEGKIKLTDTYSLEELDLDKNFGELYKIGPDKELTVEELLKIMLEQSDNTAMRALTNVAGKIGVDDPFADIYSFMGWILDESDQEPNYREVINLKTLSNMFLALYNATYINFEHSNQILTYLTNTPFNDKIAAGTPGDIPVSHKIGIASNKETFSDCGIVYAPNRNYLLCLGSNGADEKKAGKFMSEVSEAVYQFVIDN